MKLKLIEVETAIKIKLSGILEQLNQRHNLACRLVDFVEDYSVESEDQHPSTQFLQMRKYQLLYLQEHFGRYCIM